MSDYIVSLIRTWVPLVVGAGLTWLSDELGIRDIDTATAAGVAVTIVTGVYYALARILEARFPQLGWLLGSPRPPSYEPKG